MVVAVCRDDSANTARSVLTLILRYRTVPKISAHSAATAADSVGENTPDQMPPSSTNGRVSEGVARNITPGNWDTGTCSDAGMLRRLAISQMAIISASPIITPGTSPAKNRAPIEAPEIKA